MACFTRNYPRNIITVLLWWCRLNPPRVNTATSSSKIRSVFSIFPELHRYGPEKAPTEHRHFSRLMYKKRARRNIKTIKVIAWQVFTFCKKKRYCSSCQCEIRSRGLKNLTKVEVTLTKRESRSADQAIHAGNWSIAFFARQLRQHFLQWQETSRLLLHGAGPLPRRHVQFNIIGTCVSLLVCGTFS